MKLPLCLLVAAIASSTFAQAPATAPVPSPDGPPPGFMKMLEPPYSDHVKLADVWMRDACVLTDLETQTYTLVAPAFKAVRTYTSKDLITWEGPHIVFRTPDAFWPGVEMRGIWAPEMHRYKGKYYLFLTFDSATKFAEQWRDWLPRVRRGSQILVADSPRGPFTPFELKPTLPEDMMTLDGTLWVEAGVPYMVYCHEWVQIVNGTVEMVRLEEDLSGAVGEPKKLFWGNEGAWAKRSDTYGCWVTDGPSLFTSKSGKLFMIWSSGGYKGYATGVAVSDSGKLAGPWRQQAEPLFVDDGGHGFLFKRLDGQLMLALHQPNDRNSRIHFFELEDTGETLRIIRPYPAPGAAK